MGSLRTYSDVDILARCGRETDSAAWDEFVARFNRRIAVYVVRERRMRGIDTGPAEADTVAELTQEVYVRLLANDRRALRDFHGDNEFAVLAYLARIARTVVGDHVRRETSRKRAVRLVPLDVSGDGETKGLEATLMADERAGPDRLLSERLLPERMRAILLSKGGANAERDAMVFQLHVVEGFSAREIAEIESLGMSVTAVQAVLRRNRERLKGFVD